MKHPLHRFSKKTRNIITGLLVGAASLVVITYYLGLPGELLLRHFLTTLLFVGSIIVLAITVTALFKWLGRLLSGRREEPEDQPGEER